MKLYVFQSGQIIPAPGTVSQGEQPAIIPVMFYLIEHPKGRVLFDTGINREQWPEQYINDAVQRPEQMIDRQLAAMNLQPDDIDYVIMSHLHMDHAGGMSLFPTATFIVRKAELRAAWWPESFQWTYNFADYKDTRDFSYIELGDEDFDIFLDGTLICVDTKGHTQGHQSLIVDLPLAGKIILSADAVDMAENIEHGTLPAVVWNSEETKKAIAKMQHYHRQGVFIIMAHDQEQFETLKVAPDYYQ